PSVKPVKLKASALAAVVWVPQLEVIEIVTEPERSPAVSALQVSTTSAPWPSPQASSSLTVTVSDAREPLCGLQASASLRRVWRLGGKAGEVQLNRLPPVVAKTPFDTFSWSDGPEGPQARRVNAARARLEARISSS